MPNWIVLIFTYLLLCTSVFAQQQQGDPPISFDSPALWDQGDKDLYDLSEILLNRLEIVDIFHKKKTKVHPRGRFTVKTVIDPTAKTGRLRNVGGFSKNIPELPTEYYAGGHAKTKFKFSLEIERYKNGNIKKVKEIIIDGVNEAGNEKVEAQVTTFDNAQKLETITNCDGHMAVDENRGESLRLLGEKKTSLQSFLKCKTVTNQICKKVNSPLGDSYQHTRHRRDEGDPVLMGYLKNAYQDTYEFKPAQEENSNDLKKSLAPAGSLRYGRWPSSDHHNIELQGKSDAFDRDQTDWAFDTCKSVAAMVRPRYKMLPQADYQKYLAADASIQRMNSAAVQAPEGVQSEKKTGSK